MRFFCCLIFLSCIFVKNSFANNNNNYILCTSHCSDVRLSFVQPLTFPEECQNNNTVTNIQAYALACIIEYRINYDFEDINIKFQASNDTNIFEDRKPSEYLTQEIRLDLKKHRTQPNEVTRTYRCNSKNDCARDFYLNTIYDLVNDGQKQLNKIKGKLYTTKAVIGESSKRHCIDNNLTGTKTSELCGYGLCFVRQKNYTLNQERTEKQQKCYLEENSPSLFSSIEYHAPKPNENDNELLEYKCNKHVCNRNEMILIIQELINQYTRWNPIEETIPVEEKKASSSMKQTISSYIVVLFLILIQLFF
ncbi:unnamed protein product [Rotaria sordida]|uniref:Uncharacterized protein n=1 Tax=Rotaria sordida TaxID=392033 RepID=A0A813XWF0_9BILA|nr:unnamed protein product [Rotaria sordida]CAF0874073.1 unnamed protein product [Rotaria sordida]